MDVSALTARCRAIATSTWSDALDQLGVDGVIHGLTLRSGAGAICGPAVTVQESAGTFPASAFAPADFLDAAQSGTVLIIAAGGASISTFGGLAALAAAKTGIAGVVIDGACRDLSEIRETGLWLSSRHVTPKSGKERIRVEAINVPIEVCGVRVAPEDWIVGDETGVVCVPAARIDRALTIAEELTHRDALFAAELRAGRSFRETAVRMGHW
jgi:regulator of RNase E activity RraA